MSCVNLFQNIYYPCLGIFHCQDHDHEHGVFFNCKINKNISVNNKNFNTLKGLNPGGTVDQVLTLMMTSAQVVETSVTVTDNSPFQDYPHPDDNTTRSTVKKYYSNNSFLNKEFYVIYIRVFKKLFSVIE